jgi:hypothetical protein
MKIYDVASFAWDNAIKIEFGNRASWDTDSFQCKWFSKNYPNVWEKGGASGLYWFLIKDKTMEDLKQIVTPKNLPEKGTNIATLVTKNIEIFQENLCDPDKDGFLVIYNGHEQNVFSRIRSHFALNNNKTTAIGFGKYDISNYDLEVRIFHHKLPMDGLSENDKSFVIKLLKEKAGREAVESCWRAYSGWPILCKR